MIESTTKQIPLNKLVISQENVRIVNPSKQSDKELIASIESVGILQNLVVDIKDNGQGEVIAGGRRLAALQYLAKKGEIPKDAPVDCRIKEEGLDITEVSLAENMQRTAMHPADQYVAFAKLRDQDNSVDEIAEKFGISKKSVEKRLALGRVAPKLIEHYRSGKIDLNCLMAFTVGASHERQLACYKELSRNGEMWASTVKRWLVGESYSTDNGLGRFVGKAAYTKAGGNVSSDLFQETVYLSDPGLVVELANKKLETKAVEIRAEGWSWVLYDGSNVADLVQLQPELAGVPKRTTEKLTALKTELDTVDRQGDEQEWPEALCDRYHQLSDTLSDMEQKRDDKYLCFTKKQMAYSGAVLSVDHSGELCISRGLAHKKDVPQPKTVSGGGTQHTEQDANEQTISQALSDDLRVYRQQITQAALLADPLAATDVLYYSMACQILGNRYDFGSLVDSHFNVVPSNTSREDTQEGRAFDEIGAAASALNTEWLAIKDKGERFIAFRNLTAEEKSLIVTYCVASSLSVSHKGSNPAIEVLIGQLEVDYAKYWRPTADNYLNRINIGQLKTVFKEVQNNEYDDCHKNKTKGAVVINVKGAIDSSEKGATWLPNQF